MSFPPDAATIAVRLQIVDDHIRFESAQDLDGLMATFGAEPEWHNQAAEQVLRGHNAVRGFYAALFAGFPDFWLDVRRRHVAREAVIVEGILGGTQRGEWMGIAASGKTVEVPFCAVFTFEEDNLLRSEVVYYDRLSLLSQLGVLASPG